MNEPIQARSHASPANDCPVESSVFSANFDDMHFKALTLATASNMQPCMTAFPGLVQIEAGGAGNAFGIQSFKLAASG
jgi:hypothetical protein